MAGVGRCEQVNEDLGFRHARFEVSIRHPSTDEVENEEKVPR